MNRGDLTDEEWDLVGPLLPSERGRHARPSGDNRLFFERHAACPADRLPVEGHARTLRQVDLGLCPLRLWVERGVLDVLLQTLIDLNLTDDWQHMIDSTVIRGHEPVAGAKGGLVRTVLGDHAAALRVRSTPAATIRACLSASSLRMGKPPITALPMI